ncbi:MAG: hypothetical protein NT082_01735 [Chloroflexi bacterium]|jgi:hypothetical protein|nr:hypothetical protein [Chloroflexota bacterium]
MDLKQKIAEVVETSNAEFTAQCYELDEAPALGSMVKTKNKGCEIYAILYSSSTHGMDPNRRIIARGQNAGSEADIYRANPQLSKLLSTDFKALIVGYSQGKAVLQFLPPSPASIYAFVYPCDMNEVREFTQSLNFLSLLTDARLPLSPDEVIAAFLRYASLSHPSPHDFLVKAGKEIAWLLSNDIRRLDSILKRLQG